MQDERLQAPEIAGRLILAEALLAGGRVVEAEAEFAAIRGSDPTAVGAWTGSARAAFRRGNAAAARALLLEGVRRLPDAEALWVDLAVACAHLGELGDAIAHLREGSSRGARGLAPQILLGRLLEAEGRRTEAIHIWLPAIANAVESGIGDTPGSIPASLTEALREACSACMGARVELIWASVDATDVAGCPPSARIRAAILGYLGERPVVTASPRQRPTFFYVPGLPDGPFHDPMTVPWASQLLGAYPAIRAEALATIAEDAPLVDFVRVAPGRTMRDYVSGMNPAAAWEAFFFYRNGRRFDENHARCPITSATLDSSALCRIDGQAPEILFSVLRAGSEIKPHYGVTNARQVLHLPLLVPPACALHLPGHGRHVWREGELMLFDDTYLHEAWNRSTADRVILLMDCWNPALTSAEQTVLRSFFEQVRRLGAARKLLSVLESPSFRGAEAAP